MTIVNHDTGEIVETIGAAEARRLTTEAQNELRSSRDHFDNAWSLIEQAVKGGGHVDLGYRSPGDYLRSEFDGVLSGLDVTSRRLAVRTMREWGLSTRAIAPVVGTSHKTVVKDQRHVVPPVPPQTPEPSPLGEEGGGSGQTPQGAVAPVPAVPKATTDAPRLDTPRPAVTGLDGKTYTPPAPRPKATARELEDFIDSDASVQDSRYMKAVLTIAAAAQALGQYDPARVARVADEHDAMALDNLAATVAEFHRTFTAKRNGLRVIKGGIQ